MPELLAQLQAKKGRKCSSSKEVDAYIAKSSSDRGTQARARRLQNNEIGRPFSAR